MNPDCSRRRAPPHVMDALRGSRRAALHTYAAAGGPVPRKSGGRLLCLLVRLYPPKHTATYNGWCQAACVPTMPCGRNFTQLGVLQPGVVPITPGLAAAGGSLREGQAYSVLLGALFAALLLALGIPPVLSHHPAAVAAPPASAPSTPVTPTTVAPEPAAPPPTAPSPAIAPSLPIAGPLEPAPFALPPSPAPATALAGPSMSGSGTVLQGREGTPLLAPEPAAV